MRCIVSLRYGKPWTPSTLQFTNVVRYSSKSRDRRKVPDELQVLWIKKYLDLCPQHVFNDLSTSKLQISLNIDGLPLFSSSNLSAWPILCRLCLDPPVVLPISIAIGPSKPKNLDFLNDIVSELKEVLKEGLTFRNQSIEIVLHSIIADAPAKAMVKAVKQYSGYFGCDRCTQKGSWFEGRVIYPQIKNIVLRSDVHFRSQHSLENIRKKRSHQHNLVISECNRESELTFLVNLQTLTLVFQHL